MKLSGEEADSNVMAGKPSHPLLQLAKPGRPKLTPLSKMVLTREKHWEHWSKKLALHCLVRNLSQSMAIAFHCWQNLLMRTRSYPYRYIPTINMQTSTKTANSVRLNAGISLPRNQVPPSFTGSMLPPRARRYRTLLRL